MFDTFFKTLSKDYPFLKEERLILLRKVCEYYFLQVEKFNFTGHKTPETFYYLNILDCILPALEDKIILNKDAHIADLGTGGGFPGIPLAILYPESHFVLIDSVNKKLQLIDDICTEFKITNVKTAHIRVEEAGQHILFREKFDLVTAKALAHWNTLAEYCLPLVKKDGTMSVYISDQQRADVESSTSVLQILGGTLESIHSYALPEAYGERYIAHVKKTASTPSIYPRKIGTPKDQPLS
ncbi:MAG: 16S rRNA (guanine(527)-N(7))-methyltransferase RsmG [Candidatus Gracilibacteria bacterium]